MMKDTQSRVADYAQTMGYSSVVFPIAGLFTLVGASELNAFWLKCTAIFGFGITAIWMLRRIQKGKPGFRLFCWIFPTAYFFGVFLLIWNVLDSLLLALVISIPEIIGFFLCFIGIGFFIRNPHQVQIQDAQQVAAGNDTGCARSSPAL